MRSRAVAELNGQIQVMKSATEYTSDAADIMATRKALAAMVAGGGGGGVDSA